MTMTALQIETDPMIQQQLQQLTALNDAHLRQVLDYSTAMLDKLFPLEHGSHQQVKSYVVYYQHLLAFFADGQSTGLKNPAQFIALCGSKEQPQTLLFNDGTRHLEVSLCRHSERGNRDSAGIADIQLQLSDEQWFSLVRGSVVTTQKQCRSGSSYTHKAGGIYRIN
jgi:malate synthase